MGYCPVTFRALLWVNQSYWSVLPPRADATEAGLKQCLDRFPEIKGRGLYLTNPCHPGNWRNQEEEHVFQINFSYKENMPAARNTRGDTSPSSRPCSGRVSDPVSLPYLFFWRQLSLGEKSITGEVLSFHLCSASVTQKWCPLSPVYLHPAPRCHPSCRIGEVPGAEDVVQEDLLSGVSSGVIVDMMLGLLLSFQSFTMNRHHAGREMSEVLHESKTNRP